MDKSKIANFIFATYILVSLFSFSFCWAQERFFFENTPVHILPLLYTVLLLMFRRIRTVFLSLSFIIVNSVCLLRFSIYPYFVVRERFSNFSTEAIYLMAYELIVVMFLLYLYIPKVKKHERTNVSKEVYSRYKLGGLNTFLSLAIFPLIIIYPSLLSIFSLLGLGGRGESLSGVISILFQIGTMIAYIYLLSMLGGKRKGRLWALWISVFLSICYIFLTSVGRSGVSRWNFLWVGIPTAYILVAAYPRYRKQIISYALLLIPISIFIGSFVKFAISNISLEVFLNRFINSDTLDAYFGGLGGISEALMFLRGNEFAESMTCTLTDFFGNMPVVSRFFDAENLSTEAMYLDAIGRSDLICPLLAQSVIHFGIIGAPVLSVLMCIIAIESDIASIRSVNVYMLYGYRMLCVVFSLFMCLNTTIMLPKLWLLLIYIILQFVNNKYFLQWRNCQ